MFSCVVISLVLDVKKATTGVEVSRCQKHLEELSEAPLKAPIERCLKKKRISTFCQNQLLYCISENGNLSFGWMMGLEPTTLRITKWRPVDLIFETSHQSGSYFSNSLKNSPFFTKVVTKVVTNQKMKNLTESTISEFRCIF